jgi:hypothetical protein
MIIRAKQMELLSATVFETFKGRLVRHIQTCFPLQYAALGSSLTRVFVDLGIESARRHGFEGGKDICGYIDLMLVFGPDFDQDRGLPWVRAILEDNGLSRGMKMPRLLQTADTVLRRMSK